jgi:hypothetical protein
MNPSLRNRNLTRAGIASLEMVMSLPFLLGLGAMIISIGIAGVHRTTTTTQARHDIWKMRTNQPENTRSAPLSIGASADAGAIQGEATSSFKVYDWLGGSKTARSKAAVLGGVWNHREVTEFTDSPGSPHFPTLLRVVGAPAGLVNLVNGIVSLLAFKPGNQSEIDQAAQGAADADSQVEDRREDIERKLRELREELAELQRQRAELVRQRDEKQAELNRLRDEYDQLVQNGASPAALNAKQQQINQAQSELNSLNQQIQVKDQQIAAKQQEIRDWEKARDDAEAQGADIPNG